MSLFGSTAAKPATSLFGGSLGTGTQTNTGGSLFGQSNTAQPQQQQGSSLFGTLGQQNQQQNQQQQQPAAGLFGNTQSQQQQQPSTSLFGGAQSQQQQQPSTSLFGNTQSQQQQPTTSLFGNTQNQQQKPATGLFGASQTQQQQPSTSLFGSTTTMQPPQAPGQVPLGNSLFASQQQPAAQPLPKLGQSAIWQPPPPGPRDKTVTEQMQLLLEKWSPDSPSCQFEYYFYNTVDPGRAPFYRPGPHEDENKWEEALSKKPNEGAIPVLARGFMAVGMRLNVQMRSVAALQARLHQINSSLAQLIQKHELEFTIKAAEAKRRHIALSQRALALATKVQVLRNRGYALEPAEEELKRKLVQLERQAYDSVLNSRQDEIWSRLMKVRQMAAYLQNETEKMGKNNEEEEKIDPETMKKVEKILGDYKSQLDHLEKEVTEIRTDFSAWESAAKPAVNGNSRR